MMLDGRMVARRAPERQARRDATPLERPGIPPALEWLAVAAAAALLAWRLASPDARIGDDDFGVFYGGAAALAARHSPYVGDFVSPPWFALALVPLTWLSLDAARGVWLAFNVALLLANTLAAASLVGLDWPPRRLLLAALVFGLWPPIEFGLKLGQSSLLVWALILAALLAARADRFGTTGALLAVALVKPQLAVFFGAGLAVRAARRRALPRYLAAGATVLAALALAVLLIAPTAYTDLFALRPRTWNYWGSTVALPPLLADLSGSQAFVVLAYLPLATAGSLLLLREWARDLPRVLPYLAALTACATLLLTPYAYPYDAALLQLPALWLVARADIHWRIGPRYWLLVAACALCAAWLLARPADYTAWRYLGLLPPLALLAALITTRRALFFAPPLARSRPTLPTWAPYVALGLLAAVAYGWAFYGRGLDVPDEGLLLHVADRLAAGQVPYRDVYFIYTPGFQYLLAGLFRLFGPSLAVEHALLFAVHVALALVVYALAARLAWRPLAVAAALVVIASGVSPYRTLAGLVTVLALTRYAETGRRGWLMVSGLLVGGSYLIGQEIGLYTLAAAFGYLGLDWLSRSRWGESLRGWALRGRHGEDRIRARAAGDEPLLDRMARSRRDGQGRRAAGGEHLPYQTNVAGPGAAGDKPRPYQAAEMLRLHGVVGRAAFLLAAAAAVVLPWVALMAAQGALPTMLDDTLRVTFFHQPRYMHVPMPPLLPLLPDDLATNVVWGPPAYLLYVKLMLYLPLVVVAAAAGVLGARLLCAGADARARRALPLALFAALALGTLAFRADYYHLRQVLPVTLVLLAWLLTLLRATALQRGWPRWAAVGVVLPLGLVLAVNVGEAVANRATLAAPLETARGTVLVDATTARDLGGLLRDLAAQTAPGEPIYVAPAETAIYFLADRPNPTRFGQLVPTETVVLREHDSTRQKELIAAVESAGVRWIVTANLDNVDGVPFAGYAPLIAAYLDSHFAPVARHGYWTLQRRVSP